MTQIQRRNELFHAGVIFYFGDNAVLSVLLQNSEEYFICLCDTSIITWTSILRRCFTSCLKGFTSSTILVWTVPVRQGYPSMDTQLDIPNSQAENAPLQGEWEPRRKSCWCKRAENPAGTIWAEVSPDLPPGLGSSRSHQLRRMIAKKSITTPSEQHIRRINHPETRGAHDPWCTETPDWRT